MTKVKSIVLSEEMVTELRQFGNGGFFTITIDGAPYKVKYDNTSRVIETEAPEHIKEAIRDWWFI